MKEDWRMRYFGVPRNAGSEIIKYFKFNWKSLPKFDRKAFFDYNLSVYILCYYMVLRKKTKEELKDQAKWFLEYEENLWKITREKENEILSVLREEPEDIITNKEKLKDKLNWILSDGEFDSLYWEYLKYNKDAFSYLKNYFEKIKLFPEWYEFLTNDLIIYLLKEWSSIDINNPENEILPSDEIIKFRELVSRNINVLEKYLSVTGSKLWKFIYFLVNFDGDEDTVVWNIWKFKELWLNSIDNFAKLQKYLYSDDVDNIILFFKAWITSVDDILKLEENNLLNLNPEYIELFASLGANTPEDFIEIKAKLLFYSSMYIEIIKLLKKAWIDNLHDVFELREFYNNYWYKDNLAFFVDDIWIKWKSNLLELKDIILCYLSNTQRQKVVMLVNDFWINDSKSLIMLKDIIISWNIEILKFLCDEWIKDPNDLKNLQWIINSRDYNNVKLFIEAWNDNIESSWIVENYIQIKNIIIKQYPNITTKELISLFDILDSNHLKVSNLEIIFKFFSPISIWEIRNYKHVFLFYWDLPDNFEFKEHDKKKYLQYIEKFLDMCSNCNTLSYYEMSSIISDIVKLPFWDIENYLDSVNKICIVWNHPYDQFLKCFDWTSFNENAFDFLRRWFDIKDGGILWNQDLLNSAINNLYPWLNIQFNIEETKKILWFIDSIWWINKWYTILVLTMEKMVRDWISNKNFKSDLLKKLDNYKKIFDMYPEDKIPDWLKISVWLEFEITKVFAEWYGRCKSNSGINQEIDKFKWRAMYNNYANQIVDKAKIWYEHEWEFEFATKPSTNPMVALLEIHLLQELNLLDINDMQKLSWTENAIRYSGRNWTWYHLNIWSDSEIWIDENVQFIQNLCTILPRSWINNGENVRRINMQSNLNSKSSKFPIFSDAKSKKYIELRTYSVDDVELFEKNVLFNTYAIMWSQAQKKISNITSKTIMELHNNDKINNADDLFKYLDDNSLFKDGQDLKSKKIAAEFMFMQISILRTMHDYNKNFIDNELFWMNLVQDLSEPRKKCFFDILLLDKKETFWFWNEWYSSMVVKRYTNLTDNFDFSKYFNKSEPFSDDESVKILNEFWNNIDKKWIPYVTIWLNKQLLWLLLSDWVEKTQDLQDQINNKMSNIDRIKSYIRRNEKNQSLKINSQYLYDYFNDKLSLDDFNPYHWINLDFMNKIINLNNFFLKNDDTNANGVLNRTINAKWEEEENISKLSLFETWWELRKWYNYYQWWSADMLLHKTQTIAMNYMDNVINILNNDFIGESSAYTEFNLVA